MPTIFYLLLYICLYGIFSQLYNEFAMHAAMKFKLHQSLEKPYHRDKQ